MISYISRSKPFALSGLSQAVSSFTNFAIVVYLARQMGKIEFGIYSLGFALILLIVSIISIFISIQFVVNFPDKPSEICADYALSHVLAVIINGLVFIIISYIISSLRYLPIEDVYSILLIILPISISVCLYGLRDILMRIAYSYQSEYIALISAIAVGVGVILSYFFISLFNLNLSAENALYAYSIGQLFGSLMSIKLLNFPWKNIKWRSIKQVYIDSWKHGKWSIFTNIVYNIRTQSHNFLIIPLIGPSALAEVNAARVLVAPAVMAIPPITQILLPRLAEYRVNNSKKFYKIIFTYIFSFICVAITYSAFVMLFYPAIVRFSLGPHYSGIGKLVFAWCVVVIFMATRSCLSIGLQALRSFRDLFYANAFTAFIVLISSYYLIKSLGAIGSVVSFAIAEAFLVVILSKAIVKPKLLMKL